MSLQAAANLLARHGREGDSVLVHMSPDEVRGLQQLAEMHGTTLTINPHTGMPEAFNLKDLVKVALPIAAGVFLGPGAFGIEGLGLSAAEAGLATGAGATLLTGDIQKGIQAGLGAYGGAGLGSAASKGLEAAQLAKDSAAINAVSTGAEVVPETKMTLGEAFKAATGDKGVGGLSGGQLAKYGMAALGPALMASSQRGLSGVPGGAFTPTAAVHPKYAYRDEQGNVQYVDLPGVKMADWKPEQSINDYASSLVAPPRYAAEGGLMDQSPLVDDQELMYQNSPVARMADGGVTDAAVQQWFAANPGATDAQIASAMQQYSVSPEQVSRVTGVAAPQVQQRYETAIAPQIVAPYTEGIAGPGGTTATPGTGYLGIYDQLQNAGVSAQELFSNPNYKGWSQPAISHAYDVAAAINQFDPRTDKVTPSDKEWVNFMDANNFSTRDIAQATGLSQAEVQRRYDAAKMLPVKPTTVLPGGGVGTTDTYTGGVSTTPQTYAPAGTTNPYGNYINPGDITRNPDGTITVQPNVPGRPYGGFTGMGQVRDAYTAGGGRLGQVLAPTQQYQNTGLSAAAYDYLSGKGAWPTYTQQANKPLDSFSDWTNPPLPEKVANASRLKVWKNGQLVTNPFYGYKEETKTAATQQAAAPAETPVKNGGLLAAYAAGGMSGGGYDLGGYSDGGRLLRGPGDGVSDSIPATIGHKRPARLADGEFVVPARIVSEIGNGSTEAGARKLYAMMDRVQQARKQTVGKGRSKVAKDTRASKYLPA